MPINHLGYSCIKKLQRDNLWHAYNEPINFYSALSNIFSSLSWHFLVPVINVLFKSCENCITVLIGFQNKLCRTKLRFIFVKWQCVLLELCSITSQCALHIDVSSTVGPNPLGYLHCNSKICSKMKGTEL